MRRLCRTGKSSPPLCLPVRRHRQAGRPSRASRTHGHEDRRQLRRPGLPLANALRPSLLHAQRQARQAPRVRMRHSAVFKMNPEAKLPRPLSLTKLDCFTCSDFPCLILTIPTCLSTYEIDYSEVVNVQGNWFCCRCSTGLPRHITSPLRSSSIPSGPAMTLTCARMRCVAQGSWRPLATMKRACIFRSPRESNSSLGSIWVRRKSE